MGKGVTTINNYHTVSQMIVYEGSRRQNAVEVNIMQ